MKGNILIVDDEPTALKLLKDILGAEGYSVRLFANGELALRSITAEAPELILLDIRMPGLDGLEICRRLKQSRQWKEIPVIFISAASDVEDKVKAFQAGGVDYIIKPFQREEVLARVQTHVTLGRSLHELTRLSEALRKREESLKIAQSIAHLGHWEWDLSSGQVSWSDEMHRILGIPSTQPPLSHDSFLQVVHPDDRERVAAHLERVLDGLGFDTEFRILSEAGKTRVVHGKGELVSLDTLARQATFIGTIQVVPPTAKMTMLGVMQDITERKELEMQLERQANTDHLTGCSSRRHFLDMAEREVAHSRRYGGALSVLMLDLDHFKDVNDRYGHHVGDLALRTLVDTCQDILREIDVAGRLGGEEFAVLLPETAGTQALEVAERLRQAIAAAEVPLEGAPPLRITTSIGVATLIDADARIDTVLKRADQALYQAKRDGRNKVCAMA